MLCATLTSAVVNFESSKLLSRMFSFDDDDFL